MYTPASNLTFQQCYGKFFTAHASSCVEGPSLESLVSHHHEPQP